MIAGVETLSYCTDRDIVNAFRWRRFLWRHCVWICLACAIASAPWFVHFILTQPIMSAMFDRIAWHTMIAIAAAAQVMSLLLWMAMLLGMLRDERRLTDAEEAAIPATLVVLVLWGIMDLLISASCWLAEMSV